MTAKDDRIKLEEAAVFYLRMGLTPLPLNDDKKPLVKWKRLQTESPTEDEVRGWFKKFGDKIRRIAIITGAASGNIWVLDADGRQAMDWAQKHCPYTPIRGLTLHGMHYYYRMRPGEVVKTETDVIPGFTAPPGEKMPQVDIRGEGGNAVVPPSPHSEGHYRWLFPEGCDDIEALWEQIPEWSSPAVAKPRKSKGNGTFDPDLAALDTVARKLAIPVGLVPVMEGQRNATLARLAGQLIAQNRSKEETLLILLGWNARNQPPLLDSEVEYTVNSIIAAHERRYRVKVQERFGVSDEMTEWQNGIEEEAPPTESLADVPPGILKPGGILEEYVRYVRESTVTSFDLFSLGSGLCLLGTLLGQKVMTETGLRTNLYVICLSPSGSGKDAPLKAIPVLLQNRSVNAVNLLGPDQLASSASLWTALQTRPSQLLLLDEIGDLMCAVNKKPDLAKSALAKDLKKLYTSTDRGSYKSYANVKNTLVLDWHCLSLYATGVPGAFFDNLTVQDVTDGFIARTLIWSLNLETQKPKKEASLEPSFRVIEAVKYLNSIKIVFEDDREEVPKRPVPVVVPKTDEASACFDEWRDKYVALQNDTRSDKNGVASIYARVAEQASKIALIHAVSKKGGIPRNVPLESVEYACRLMDWTTPRTVHQVRASVAYNAQDALVRRITEIIEYKGKISREQIYRTLKDCNHKQAEDAISIVVNSGKAKKCVGLYKGQDSYYLCEIKHLEKIIDVESTKEAIES